MRIVIFVLLEEFGKTQRSNTVHSMLRRPEPLVCAGHSWGLFRGCGGGSLWLPPALHPGDRREEVHGQTVHHDGQNLEVFMFLLSTKCKQVQGGKSLNPKANEFSKSWLEPQVGQPGVQSMCWLKLSCPVKTHQLWVCCSQEALTDVNHASHKRALGRSTIQNCWLSWSWKGCQKYL